jgi:hypothetical protein
MLGIHTRNTVSYLYTGYSRADSRYHTGGAISYSARKFYTGSSRTAYAGVSNIICSLGSRADVGTNDFYQDLFLADLRDINL